MVWSALLVPLDLGDGPQRQRRGWHWRQSLEVSRELWKLWTFAYCRHQHSEIHAKKVKGVILPERPLVAERFLTGFGGSLVPAVTALPTAVLHRPCLVAPLRGWLARPWIRWLLGVIYASPPRQLRRLLPLHGLGSRPEACRHRLDLHSLRLLAALLEAAPAHVLWLGLGTW